MNILIVENDEVVTRLWSHKLSFTHVVRAALSVKEALVEIEKKLPDLVLLDLRLNGPTNSGLTVYEHIRNKLNESIPIIFITGLEYNVSLYKEAKDKVSLDSLSGINTQMVQKPISIKRLDDLVNSIAA